MQTTIASRPISGPSASGPDQARLGPGAAEADLPNPEDQRCDQAGPQDFASFMVDKAVKQDVSEDDISGHAQPDTAAVMLTVWPAQAISLGAGNAAAGLAPAGPPSEVRDQNGPAVDPATLMQLTTPPVEEGVTAPKIAIVIPSGLTPNPQWDPTPLEPATTGLAGPQPVQSEPGTEVGLTADEVAVPLDPARPPAVPPGLAMATAGLRFWQAMPVTAPDVAAASDLLEEAGLPRATMAEADSLAPYGPLAAANLGSTPAATTVGLGAKLAETALQALFAAQAEVATHTLVEEEGLGWSGTGLLSAATTAAAAPIPGAASHAATLPQLAGQLVQTLSQRPDGTTEIALSPNELGHVRVTLQADAQNPDRIIVMLNFERPETLDLFRRNADQLAEALRDAGFTGADIGFGRSEGGQNHDAPPPPMAENFAKDSLAAVVAGPEAHHSPRHLVTTSTLDLRL